MPFLSFLLFLERGFQSEGGALLPPPSLALPPPSSEAAEEGARWSLLEEGLDASPSEEEPSSLSASTEVVFFWGGSVEDNDFDRACVFQSERKEARKCEQKC